jgi:hypothetical protein
MAKYIADVAYLKCKKRIIWKTDNNYTWEIVNFEFYKELLLFLSDEKTSGEDSVAFDFFLKHSFK